MMDFFNFHQIFSPVIQQEEQDNVRKKKQKKKKNTQYDTTFPITKKSIYYTLLTSKSIKNACQKLTSNCSNYILKTIRKCSFKLVYYFHTTILLGIRIPRHRFVILLYTAFSKAKKISQSSSNEGFLRALKIVTVMSESTFCLL